MVLVTVLYLTSDPSKAVRCEIGTALRKNWLNRFYDYLVVPDKQTSAYFELRIWYFQYEMQKCEDRWFIYKVHLPGIPHR